LFRHQIYGPVEDTRGALPFENEPHPPLFKRALKVAQRSLEGDGSPSLEFSDRSSIDQTDVRKLLLRNV
jgi:hypothetical protein